MASTHPGVGGPKPTLQRPTKPAVWSASRLVAHHLIRTGYSFVTSYPGSPTTEITDELERLDKRKLITFRFAANEKVAFEMAAAVALSGGHAAAVMKHVGLNVALDSVFGTAYMGHRGSLLLIVGDDPACDSSSTAQDTRLTARLLNVPCFEPASIEDVPRTLDLATSVSTTHGTLVIVRMTTALCHSSGFMTYPNADKAAVVPALAAPRGDKRFTVLPAASRANHVRTLESMQAIRVAGEEKAFWEEDAGDASGGLAFVVQNSLYEPFRRACASLNLSPPIYRSRMAWPIAQAPLAAFLGRHERVVVVEELADFLQPEVIALAHRERLATRIEGSEWFPRHGRLDEDRLLDALAKLTGSEHPAMLGARAALNLPQRPPTFCAGCPHTASFYGLKLALEALPEQPVVAQDIGCYSMGMKSGIELGGFSLCMGSSIGMATGLAMTGQRAVALIGDSTFVHAGLPSLKNAVMQGVNLLVCILHNGHAAMTGGPATDSPEQFKAFVGALGVAAVEVVDPFDGATMASTLQRFFATPGVTVLIAASPCALTVEAKPRRPRVDLDRCTGCGDCVTKIHCPAISLSAARKFQVDVSTCVGCGFCSTICPEKALKPEPFEQ